MKCIRCGSEVSMSSKYCRSCGTVISKDTILETSETDSKKNGSAGKVLAVLLGVGVIVSICAKLFSGVGNSGDAADNNYSIVSENIEDTEWQEEENNINENAEFMLPESHVRYLTKSELAGLSAEQCRIARNEIYARHGRMFTDEGLRVYFESFDWYVPCISPNDFEESMLNEYEMANRDLIVEYETEQGYR